MDAQKRLWIESLLHRCHRFAQQVRFGSCADPHIILLRGYPANFRHREKQDASPRFEDDTRCISFVFAFTALTATCRSLCEQNLITDALDRRVKTFGSERLEQV